MWKALLKKQLMEMASFTFRSKKGGKHRSVLGTVGFGLLYLFALACLGFAFYLLSDGMAVAMFPLGLGWFYYVMIAAISVFMGVLGSVFSASVALYRAKDNDFLLSLPIPPRRILAVRVLGVYFMGLLFEAVIYVPALIAGYRRGRPVGLGIVNPLLLFWVLSVLILVLTCALGWLVALISGKLKNKSYVTVLLTLVFVAIYYFVYFRLISDVEGLLAQIIQWGGSVQEKAYPLYVLGRAAEGDAVSMLWVCAAVLLLAAVTGVILSRTFIRIATAADTGSKKAYREKAARVRSVEKTLLYKEWKRLTGSPVYLLNCAMGTILLTPLAIAGLFFKERLQPLLTLEMFPDNLISVALIALVCMAVSTVDTAAPSVSLEGRNLWLLQTLPVEPRKALSAKERLQWLLTLPPLLAVVACGCIVTEQSVLTAALLLVLGLVFMTVSSSLGLCLNLLRPDFSWMNETAPVKQSLPVGICLMGGWAVAMLLAVVGYFVTKHMAAEIYLLLCTAALLAVSVLLHLWLHRRGAEVFAELS